MKIIHQIAINQRLRNEPAWKLLSAANAPMILSLLGTHLLGSERRLPSSIFHERIYRDLSLLKNQGVDMPQSAQSYVADWLNAGFLERSYESKDSEEIYELSSAAIKAMRFVQSLDDKRTVATETRLSMVIQQLVQLAEQTETNPQSRIESLLKERQRIDEQIESIRSGNVKTLSDNQALERSAEIISLADELANDFRQVRTAFQNLNRALRENIMENEGSRGEVLESLFAGVDVIADSDEGRTFKAFWRLLTDPEQSMELEVALEQVLDREFAQQLDRQERRFLMQLTRVLMDRGAEVHEVLQHFARGLKQFVQSREYLEHRRINKLLKSAQRAGLAIKDQLKPAQEITTLDLTGSKISSISQFQLRDPTLDEVDANMQLAGEATISLEAVSELVAHSEIDFRRLKQHISNVLQAREQASIAEILNVYPAEQGLGSIVGYVSLGARFGVLSSQETELVDWEGLDGVQRQAKIPSIYFVREHCNQLQ